MCIRDRSHGLPVNASGRLYDIAAYDVDENGLIDYDGNGKANNEKSNRIPVRLSDKLSLYLRQTIKNKRYGKV